MNISLTMRYMIWIGLLIAASIIAGFSPSDFRELTGNSGLPTEGLATTLSILLLLSAYLLFLKNRYFLSALWMLAIVSTSWYPLLVLLMVFGDIAYGITFSIYLIALMIHNYLFWEKTKNK